MPGTRLHGVGPLPVSIGGGLSAVIYGPYGITEPGTGSGRLPGARPASTPATGGAPEGAVAPAAVVPTAWAGVKATQAAAAGALVQ